TPHPSDQPLPQAAHDQAQRTLALLQAWITDQRLADMRLVILTPGAVAARDGEAPELTSAPVWGLVRSAQSEHPDRFTLLDHDHTNASLSALPGALTLQHEPQLALRQGTLL